jgi:hypothetical protein
MTKQNFTLYTYRTDKRCKTGTRLLATRVVTDMTEDQMELLVKALSLPGYQYEYVCTTKTVRSYMTGKEVVIDSDTPWCCNPASETYWSM